MSVSSEFVSLDCWEACKGRQPLASFYKEDRSALVAQLYPRKNIGSLERFRREALGQPTFFRYFPTKDAVLREVGEREYACICERLRSEVSSKAHTSGRLRRFYLTMAREVEADRQLWQAVVLSGAMDPVRSAELRGQEEAAVRLLREILMQGQKQGEVTRTFPVVHLAEFMEGLYNTVVRQWAVDLTGPHKLTERVRSAVEFFLRGIQP
jgi:AcrR family transcriptional regulator